jgi:hypothetical protein
MVFAFVSDRDGGSIATSGRRLARPNLGKLNYVCLSRALNPASEGHGS